MMKTYLLKILMCAYLVFLLVDTLSAQSISGRVIDKESTEPIAYANIVLLNARDSAYITGSTTGLDGFFFINNDSIKNHILQISFLGYQPQFISLNKSNVGTIALTPSSVELAEVIVKGNIPIFKMETGGISANVQNTQLKNMGTLPDILGQLPFVVKNMNSYTVIGKGIPIFYINNRLVRDESEIQQISSKDIKKVTVITEPGAEYDASVNAVIRIETLRPQGEGVSGTLHSYAMYRKTWSNVDWANLNYRLGGFDIFGRIQFRSMSYPKKRRTINNIRTESDLISIQSIKNDDDGFQNLISQIGINYSIKENHSIGTRYENNNMFDTYGKSTSDIDVFQNAVLDNSLFSEAGISGKNNSHHINTYYNGKLHGYLFIKIDVDYKYTDQETNTNITNSSNDVKDPIRTKEEASSTLYAGKLTLNTPVLDGDLTYGVELSHTNNKQDFYVHESSGNPGLISSDNNVDQGLIAAFISYRKSIKKFDFNLGGRYENVQFEYYQQGNLLEEQSKKFNRFFPNANISYREGNIQMQLSYRNTTFRPSYYDLRSTIVYQAPYSYYSGNPYLKPTDRNSVSYMLFWGKITFLTSYTHYTDRIVYFPHLYMGNSILLKPINVEKSQNLTSSIGFAPTINIWKPRLELMFMKDYIKMGNPEIKYNNPIWGINFRNNFQINGWQFGFDLYYSSKGNQSAEYTDTYWQSNMYINKSFFNENLLVNLNTNDLFDSNRYKVNYISNSLNSYYNNNMYRQYISAGITYRFNTINNRYKGSRASDELDRL